MPRKSNTRAAQGAGSIRQRSDGTWEARFVVGHDPGTGKPIRKSVYAKTQKEVRQKLAQAVAAVDNSDYFEPSKMTLAQWLDVWAAEYMGDKRYSTKKTYKANIETHIKPAIGAVNCHSSPLMLSRNFTTLCSQADAKCRNGTNRGISSRKMESLFMNLRRCLQKPSETFTGR